SDVCSSELPVVVADDDLERPPVDAAGRVDLLDRELHRLAVGLEEGGHAVVAVELADPVRLAGGAGDPGPESGHDGRRERNACESASCGTDALVQDASPRDEC